MASSALTGVNRFIRCRPFATPVLAVAAAAFVIANAVSAFYKGGDFTDYLDAGRRFIQGRPLYEHSAVAAGVIGPPFQAVLAAPFAVLSQVSPAGSRLAWYLLNLACLVAAARWWHLALAPAAWRSRSFSTVIWPLIAVLYPIQANFEHQNLNPVLLALVGLATWRESQGRSRSAGAFLGAASAQGVSGTAHRCPRGAPRLADAYLDDRGRSRPDAAASGSLRRD